MLYCTSHFQWAGSSEYESASQHSSASGKEIDTTEQVKVKTATSEPPKVCDASRDKLAGSLGGKGESRAERSNSVAGGEVRLLAKLPAEHYSLSYPRFHRREAGDSGGGSPSRVQHRRMQSLCISPTVNSSRSTSAYSTLSERSAPVVALDDNESVLSSKTRVTTQTQVEQSRVPTSSVIEELLQQGDLTRSLEEEPSGLQIYVDRRRGDVVLAGRDMER